MALVALEVRSVLSPSEPSAGEGRGEQAEAVQGPKGPLKSCKRRSGDPLHHLGPFGRVCEDQSLAKVSVASGVANHQVRPRDFLDSVDEHQHQWN